MNDKDAWLEMCYLVWERTRLQLLLGAAKGKGMARAEERRKKARGTWGREKGDHVWS